MMIRGLKFEDNVDHISTSLSFSKQLSLVQEKTREVYIQFKINLAPMLANLLQMIS